MTPRSKLSILFVLAGVTLCIVPWIGPMRIMPADVFGDAVTPGRQVFWQLRIPQMLAACIAGAALAVGGMTFQGMFRNPLVTPFTLGVSSGAAFGAAVYMKLGWSIQVLGFSGLTVAAFLGALLAVAAVYGLSCTTYRLSAPTMLLAGVAMSFFFASLIMLIQYLSDAPEISRLVYWLMGGVEIVGTEAIWEMLPLVLIGGVAVWWRRDELNLLSTSETLAAARGVDVDSSKRILFIGASLMVGSVVAICGPIGFVGMMVPHICRLLLGPNHRVLFWGSIIFGAAFLAVCDMTARILIAPARLPVGILTALLGGPFFIWLLMRDRGKG
jgi:iron complex transport system permease protein